MVIIGSVWFLQLKDKFNQKYSLRQNQVSLMIVKSIRRLQTKYVDY